MRILNAKKLGIVTTALAFGIGMDVGLAQDKSHESSAMRTATQEIETKPLVRTIVGEVVAVDVAQRMLTVKGPRGRVFPLAVGPEVGHLEDIKPGTRLAVDYRLGMALALMKGGDGIREKVETMGTVAAERGSPPNPPTVKRTTIVANVERVDHKKNIAVLKNPDGQLVEMQVSEPALLKDMKVGDQVVANIYQAAAIKVRPVSSEKK